MMAGGAPGAVSGDRFVFAVVRGDMEVSENKLAGTLRTRCAGYASETIRLRPATEEEIRTAGAVPGYASPLGLPASTLVIVDEAVPLSPNLAAGANEEGFHLLNTNIPRDYQPTLICDIAAAQEGDGCARCGTLLSLTRGVEVGHIFKLGDRYSAALGATFQDPEGRERPIVMGSYGIGTGRLLACVAEEHHDEHGLRWPVTVAPFDVHLVCLGAAGSEPGKEAQRVYHDLQASGLEVLFDDRDESPGVKFADADLIGVPFRLTVSARSQKTGGVEMKRRDREEKTLVPAGLLAARVKAELESLRASLLEQARAAASAAAL